MNQPGEPVAPTPDPDPADVRTDSLVADLRDLASDTRTALEAELVYQSARARLAGREIRQVALWTALAGLLAFVMLLTLAVGAVIALSPLMGGVAATLAVVFFFALAAAVAAVVAYQGVRGLREVGRGKDPDQPT